MKTLGLDIGTTTISAVVLDSEESKAIAHRTVENNCALQTGNDWEKLQDADAIAVASTAVIDELLDLCPDIGAIGLTGQMHGILYTDGQGRVLSPLFTWQDQRGALQEGGKDLVSRIREQTGLRVPAGYGLVTHLYQERHGAVPSGAASLCTIPDYLGMALTGRTMPLIHISMAASIGFYDPQGKCFRKDLLRKAGGDTGLLPEITDRFSVLGEYKGRPVTAAVGDNQASFIGSVGLQPGTLLLNIGTGGQISILSERAFEAPGIEARPLTGDTFLLVGASLCGGRAYAILERFFREYAREILGQNEPQYSVMERLAEKAPASSCAMEAVTTFSGTRTDPDATGSLLNITEENFTPAGMTAAFMRGIVKELYDLYEIILKGTGDAAERIVGSGNGIRKNEALRRIASQMFGREVVPAPYDEEAACGAAVIAGHAVRAFLK